MGGNEKQSTRLQPVRVSCDRDDHLTFKHLHERVEGRGVLAQTLSFVKGENCHGAGRLSDEFATDDGSVLVIDQVNARNRLSAGQCFGFRFGFLRHGHPGWAVGAASSGGQLQLRGHFAQDGCRLDEGFLFLGREFDLQNAINAFLRKDTWNTQAHTAEAIFTLQYRGNGQRAVLIAEDGGRDPRQGKPDGKPRGPL